MISLPLSLLGATLLVAPTAIPISIPTGDGEDVAHWSQWRGPSGTGSTADSRPPVEWSEDHNIRWKVPIPGRGTATPIIWEDRIYVLTAIPTDEVVERPTPPAEDPPAGGGGRRGGRRGGFGGGAQPDRVHEFAILAIDREDGSTVWESVARKELPHAGTHRDGTFASASAVTDGKYLFAFFGSRGLFAYDLEGEKLWEKDYGDMTTRNSFGEGASPALYGDTLVLTWDHEGDSFIVALDKKTGDERWRVDRDERTTWATPLIVESGSGVQVITSGTTVRSYNLATGELLWQTGGMTSNPIPSPIFWEGMVFVTTGYRGSALKAIELDAAKGDISESEAIVWSADRDTPYVPSPLLHQGILYILKVNTGILTAFDAKTGEKHFGPERLEGVENVYASPVGAADRVYLPGRDGATMVIAAGPEFEVLAVNELAEGFDASPAIVDDEIYLRGREHLYCIAEN